MRRPTPGPPGALLPVLVFLALLPGTGCRADGRAPAEPAPAAATKTGETGTASPARPSGLRFPDQLRTPVEATIFSFPIDYFDPDEIVHFLGAARTRMPDQDLVVLADAAMERGLAPHARRLDLTLVPTGEHLLSPWPRDPFSVAVDDGGGVVLVDRPYRQPTREGDADMARVLAGALPGGLVRAWGGVRRWEAPVPFHNGHMLLTGDALWVSLHSLEPRILEILDADRVPVESFGTAAGIDRYLDAADRAAEDLASLYDRPVRWVHPLPRSGPPDDRRALMLRIGGGAGFDLDSVLTLLPDGDGGSTALVGSLADGRDLVGDLAPEDRAAFASTFALDRPGEEITSGILRYAETGRASGLGRFLDLVADHLEERGLPVRRLPSILVPLDLVPGTEGLLHPDFLVGWNNVVVEPSGAGVRALGFSSGLPSGDRRARRVFAEAGAHLELLPPLPSSILNNGGYRCASNQVRRPPGPR